MHLPPAARSVAQKANMFAMALRVAEAETEYLRLLRNYATSSGCEEKLCAQILALFAKKFSSILAARGSATVLLEVTGKTLLRSFRTAAGH